jgi:hypothetical protein
MDYSVGEKVSCIGGRRKGAVGRVVGHESFKGVRYTQVIYPSRGGCPDICLWASDELDYPVEPAIEFKGIPVPDGMVVSIRPTGGMGIWMQPGSTATQEDVTPFVEALSRMKRVHA